MTCARVLADLKFALESSVTETEFVYTTYIRTTPERLWRALHDPEFTRAYWGVAFTADWAAGAPMTWEERDTATVDPEQRVLVWEPHRRLRVKLTVVHGRLEAGGALRDLISQGWPRLLSDLKSLLETGAVLVPA